MENLDISNFRSVSAANDADNILMALSNGMNGKMTVALFKTVFGKGISPNIKNGTWWIGSIDTGVKAEGKTPEFRKTETGIEYKYISDPDTTWRLLVDMAAIKLYFDDLTEEEKRSLIPNLKDFTPEEIAELQKPADDMIAKLEQTDKTIAANEEVRKQTENERISDENTRKQKENDRQLAEQKREEAEQKRGTAFKQLVEKSNEATLEANTQADRAQAYSDNPPKIGDNGNWWVWDEETGEYRDTGTFARGDTMFATFDIDIKTGSLVCTTPDKYTGPSFSLENGELYVNINE